MKDSEKNRCTLEEITLNHTNRQYVVLPEIIFQTDDIVLVGAGSFSCVRALYKTAVKQRALGRFLYRVITPEQYAMGQAEEIIRDLIDEALKRTNAGGIIYYASCMDVVSRIDFQKIKKKLCNPAQIPVEVLYRGPMVRRYLDSNKKLTELLMQIPVSKEMLKNQGCDLPPVMPDFEAVCGVLQSWKVYRFLISSGGCDGCISGTGERDQEYRVTKSRVDDLQIAVGCEPFIENGIIWDYQNKECKDLVCITGAGLPKLIGYDYGRIEKRMKKEKIDCIMMKTDGYTMIDGKKIHNIREINGLGYVPQAHPLSFSYTVRQIITMGRTRYVGTFSVPSAKDREAVEQAMEETGISDLADRSCNQLSGGQMQMALIARALAGNPKIMILDEPESHLDFKNQFLILKLIERLADEKNISCIINTHFPEHALMMSDKTLLLGDQKYLFGNTEDMVEEEHIAEYFQIRSKIAEVKDGENSRKAFVVLDISDVR